MPNRRLRFALHHKMSRCLGKDRNEIPQLPVCVKPSEDHSEIEEHESGVGYVEILFGLAATCANH